MPTIPQYTAQRRTGQIVRGAIPGAVNVQGLTEGISSGLLTVADDKLREQAKIEHQQTIERERLARDEAAVHVINAESDMQMRVAEAATKAEQEGADGMTARVLKDYDNWTQEKLQSAPESARPLLEKTLARMRGDVNAKLYGAEMKARQRKVITDFEAGTDADERLVFADPSQAAAAMARRKALASALALPADARDEVTQKAVGRIAYSAASAVVDRDPDAFLREVGVAGGKTKDGKPLPSDPEKAKQAVASNPILSNLEPGNLQRLVERATMLSVTRQAQMDAERERRARQAEAAQNKAFREATAAYTIMEGAIAAGRQIDMTNPQNIHLIKQIQQVPEYAAAFKSNLQYAAQNTAVAMQPIPQQEATLNALYAQRNTQGTSPGLEKEIARVEKVVKESRTAYAQEPLKAAADYGVIPAVAPLDVSSLDTVTQGLSVRSQQAQVAGQQAGKPVSPFTSDEATKVAQQLLSLPADQQGVRIAQLTSQMTPQQATAFAKQIDPQARALSLAMAAGSSMTTEGRTVSGLILRGQQAIKDKAIKEDAGAEFGLRATLAKKIGDAFSGPNRDAVLDAARYIYIGKQAAGERVTEEGAIALAAGGPIVEVNGRKIPAPIGVDVEARLSAYPAKDVASQAPDGNVYIAGKPVPVSAFVSALPDAQLEPLSVGRYMVRSGGNLVSNAARKPIVIELK